MDAPGIGRVLLTGAAGRLGTVLRPHLLQHWALRSADVRAVGAPLEGEETLQFDLTDCDAVREAVQGCDAVVHFGGIPLEADFAAINDVNITGTYNVFEAARQEGIKRIVFASSHHVMGYVANGERVGVDAPVRPDGLYAVSKVFGEALGRHYWERYGIEHASLRIGMCVAEPFDHRSLGIWLSFPDLCRLVIACLKAPRLGYTALFGQSANNRAWLSNAGTDHVGYNPADNSEDYAARILAAVGSYDPSDKRQAFTGGYFTTENPPRWQGVDMVFVPSQFGTSP